jgi:pyruvate/2-oxoglutarate dehydrogenase complex dihydrolipoamide dehydrogenase (E3) component
MQFDVIIVGSGQAGVPLASRLAAAGKRVLIAERGEFGGTCVNDGCTPTKTLVASARAAHVARTCGRLGVRAPEVDVDFAAVMARKDAIVKRWREGVVKRLERGGERLTVVHGAARFTGPRELVVGDTRYTANTMILNVGARASVPRIPGLDPAQALTSHSLLELRELPERLLILGGGYIGCEFGQMFRRFGAEVAIVDRNAHLLSREDPDVSEALEGVFRAEQIELELSARVESVRHGSNEVSVMLAGKDAITGSHLLLALGRTPNTEELGCAAAGVKLDARGFIEVNDSYATSAEGVYAVGDVTGGPQFTHTSWDDHRLLFETLAGRPARPRSARIIPYTVFTDPQVAGVGLTETEAKAKRVPYELATLPFGSIARAIETDETAGILKLLIDPETERVLGCTIVGIEAGELLHVFSILMQAGASVKHLVDAECVHPAFAEGLQTLVMQLPRFALS